MNGLLCVCVGHRFIMVAWDGREIKEADRQLNARRL